MLGVEFNGRYSRGRYISKSFLIFFASLLLQVLISVSPLLSAAGFLYLAAYSLGVGAKRCHDLGYSGWLQILLLMPFLNVAFWLYLIVVPGEKRDNRFGSDPLAIRN